MLLLLTGISHGVQYSYGVPAEEPGKEYLRGAGLSYLEGLPLTHLYIQYCHGLTDFGHLRNLPLATLELEKCGRINDKSFQALRDLPLTNLKIRECRSVSGA